MKYLALIIFTILLLSGLEAKAEDGKDVFESLRCGICHKVDTGKTSPSLMEIAQAYKGKESQLMSYFQGESEPVVKPEKGEMMKRYIEKTKALPDGERKSLADFILNHLD